MFVQDFCLICVQDVWVKVIASLRGAWQSFKKHVLVFEEASEAEGRQLEDRLQNKDEGEDVVTDLQRLVQLLRMSGRDKLKINKLQVSILTSQ